MQGLVFSLYFVSFSELVFPEQLLPWGRER
jgi:hypothetical protein